MVKQKGSEHEKSTVAASATSDRGARCRSQQPLVSIFDLLGCQSAHGGKEYERLVSDGELIMQLHNWEYAEVAHALEHALHYHSLLPSNRKQTL